MKTLLATITFLMTFTITTLAAEKYCDVESDKTITIYKTGGIATIFEIRSSPDSPAETIEAWRTEPNVYKGRGEWEKQTYKIDGEKLWDLYDYKDPISSANDFLITFELVRCD